MNLNRVDLVLWTLLVAACGADPAPSTPDLAPPAAAVRSTPETERAPVVGHLPAPSERASVEAVETGLLARSVLSDPARAAEVLAAADLSPESFEARLYAIARSPELSASFRTALEAP
jgi:hypothetical protein